MDLTRHLRFFTSVADTRHFGDAARELGMTQPPLSQGIRRLEERLGVRLFDRDPRGVRLTAEGQLLLPAARELLRLEADLLDLATHLVVPSQVRLGVAGDLDERIDDVVGALAARGRSVTPTVAGSVELVDLLRDGLLDVAVVRHPGVVDGLAAGPVLVLPTRLDSRSHHPATTLGDLPVAVPPRHHQPPAHDQLVDALRRAGHDGRVVEAADVGQRRALTAAGVATRLTPIPAGTTDGQAFPPLRLRIVMPHEAHRRPEIEHADVAAELERALTP
ncbi:LysR family transcriptional regulator [Terrabacter aeriphilus]|uniref:LysR family transcriptional regulator n=2 Tax=Terrabacter aeriphilus TaxID=515662 RepID=A0ABP9JEJ5_9MICO